MNDERQERTNNTPDMRQAILGQDAEYFRRSHLGKHIYQRIETEEQQLIEELLAAAVESTDSKIVNIGLDIMMRRRLTMFVDEAIQSGFAAERNIQQAEGQGRDY